MLDEKEAVEFVNSENQNLLLLAAKNGKFNIFKSLLEQYDANLYVTDIKMNNCLHYAALNEDQHMIDYILGIDAERR